MKAAETKVAPRENPLVPFALMKRLYAGMVETRLLEVALAKRLGGKRSPVEGREACRAAVVLSLEADDLVVDRAGAASSAWLRGEALGEIVAGRITSLLPAFEDASQQPGVAVGAASALKRAKLPRVVAIFLAESVRWSGLRRVLTMAAKDELPLLFVAFTPVTTGKSIAAGATKLGVPGIPVEAHDAVAICRVAQESVLRARSGGGPGLIECVRLESGKRAPDPITAMSRTLLRVGCADPAWIDGAGSAFRARLKAVKHECSEGRRSTKV